MPNQTQLEQRITAAGRSAVQALRDSAEKCNAAAVEFDELEQMCQAHASDAGDLLAGIAKEQAAENRRSAVAELRRADHLVRFG